MVSVSGPNQENGNQKTIFGIPCQGCTDRAQIMGAGNWHVDAIIFASIILLVGTIVFLKYTNTKS